MSNHRDQGIQEEKAGYLPAAVSCFTQAVLADMDDLISWQHLGRLSEEPQSRQRAWQEVLRLDPNNVEAQQALQVLAAQPPAQEDMAVEEPIPATPVSVPGNGIQPVIAPPVPAPTSSPGVAASSSQSVVVSSTYSFSAVAGPGTLPAGSGNMAPDQPASEGGDSHLTAGPASGYIPPVNTAPVIRENIAPAQPANTAPPTNVNMALAGQPVAPVGATSQVVAAGPATGYIPPVNATPVIDGNIVPSSQQGVFVVATPPIATAPTTGFVPVPGSIPQSGPANPWAATAGFQQAPATPAAPVWTAPTGGTQPLNFPAAGGRALPAFGALGLIVGAALIQGTASWIGNLLFSARLPSSYGFVDVPVFGSPLLVVIANVLAALGAGYGSWYVVKAQAGIQGALADHFNTWARVFFALAFIESISVIIAMLIPFLSGLLVIANIVILVGGAAWLYQLYRARYPAQAALMAAAAAVVISGVVSIFVMKL